MKTTMIIPAIALLCSISGTALAQSRQVILAPIGAHEVANTPSAMETPATIPGGLYRLANGS